MKNRNMRTEFLSLLAFLIVATLVLGNGFVARIAAEGADIDVYQRIEPIGDVLSKIEEEYVRNVQMDRVVQGALIGMMEGLGDQHSSFIPMRALQDMREDTQGEFEGIGVQIRQDEELGITVYSPLPGSPAAEAGIKAFDRIMKIDGTSTEGMTLQDAADLIRGPRGTTVHLTISRRIEGTAEAETHELDVRRDRVPLESIKEYRVLDGDIGYIRISDFKDTTAKDLRERLGKLMDQGMRAFVLDLRWNPGGLLTASKEVAELLLPKGTLVTYTKGRERGDGKSNPEDMELYTEKRPVLPAGFPIVVLVNEQTASSAEIVTGALQYHQRAIIVGEKTFGKGSVQTIIPLRRPEMTALRLTTALYYTPAGVTIDEQGILPDIEVPMEDEIERRLAMQMFESYENDPSRTNLQNHGSVTGNEVTVLTEQDLEEEKTLLQAIEENYGEMARRAFQEIIAQGGGAIRTVEDTQLLRAVEVLRENPVWEKLVAKYHRDVSETQMAATPDKAGEQDDELLMMQVQSRVDLLLDQDTEAGVVPEKMPPPKAE